MGQRRKVAWDARWKAAVWAVGCVLAVEGVGTGDSWAQTAQPSPVPSPMLAERSLRVGVKPIEPFVFAAEQGNPTGYSIDLWTAIAPQINAQTRYVVYDTTPELLDALRRGEVDVAIAGISITASREATGLDFSHPTYEAGLQLLVMRSQKSQVARLLDYLGGGRALQAVGRVLLSSIVVGFLIWLFERRHNSHFQHGPLAGIGQGIWFAVVTLGTFGYGDVTPVGLPGRIVAGLWMGVSFFILADFISAMTTARQQAAPVQSLSDLAGQPIGASQGTTADYFLRTKPVKRVPMEDLEASLRALRSGEVVAIVIDRPVAEYLTVQEPDLVMAGDRLSREHYGIALREGDDLREEINRALLTLQEKEYFEFLCRKWFGEPQQQ
ncbi:transporter substrate-binding domain-containing protein [Thermoleptolyngbya sp. C42_A2020_037]|uniref:transporter substrate-binding domain-containing protein n=1 Tax=Thermoleptolyngbya sp. C42_A2020_037 TaxID=2747799 RepID=UPI001A00E5D6|nr:transporter substrate-binding domain-containing protein [Thermoleptolyngbya sp. C42_A2020_037]MBF2085995.1 transporter substrate-binding domain-containing protein [Thermoleptolyngbya sp. C42_A2020_037]